MITQQWSKDLKGELSSIPGPWMTGVSSVTWLFEGHSRKTRHTSNFHVVPFFPLLQAPCASL